MKPFDLRESRVHRSGRTLEARPRSARLRPAFRLASALCAALLALAGCATPPGPEPTPTARTFAPTDADIPNPERGFFSPLDIMTAPTDYATIRTALGHTLVHTNVRLDAYRDRDLPPEVLDTLSASLTDIRAGGVKIILRFTYNLGPYPDSEPDASLEQVLRHITQLKPILQANGDVIAWMEAGFVGAWGEWHTSTHGLSEDDDAKLAIVDALLDALPANRAIQLRYPGDIRFLIGQPLTPETALTAAASGDMRYRIGHHNDCFLASDTDQGTYERTGATIEDEKIFIAAVTAYTPMGGETCQNNPPRSECPSALEELARFHYTEINASYNPQVIRSWRRGGCEDEIRRRLGYRLVLDQAEVDGEVRPGGVLDLSVTLHNEGFSAPVNPRSVEVVLDGPSRFVVALTGVDPRLWAPGESLTFSTRLRVPANAPAGSYRLGLWLPDAAPTLRDVPVYAIRFANADVWDEFGGWNVLVPTLKVDPSVGGIADPTADTFAVVP